MEIGLIKGYRAFESTGNAWRGPFSRFVWQRGVNTAQCKYPRHPAPAPAPNNECECGMYAYTFPEDAFNLAKRQIDRSLVVAVVVGWGQVMVHSHLWHAQSAQVVALCDMSMSSLEASQYFSARLLPEKEFLKFAGEFGEERFKYGIPPPRLERVPLKYTKKQYANLLEESDLALERLEANIPAARAEIEIIAARMGRRLLSCQWRDLHNLVLMIQQEILLELGIGDGSWERRVALLLKRGLSYDAIIKKIRCSRRSVEMFMGEELGGSGGEVA